MTRESIARVARLSAPISGVIGLVFLTVAIASEVFPFTGLAAGACFAINLVAAITVYALSHEHTNYDGQYYRLQLFSALHFLGAFSTGLAAFATADGMSIFPYAAFVPLGMILVCLLLASFVRIALGKRYKAAFEEHQETKANKRLDAALNSAVTLSASKRTEIETRAVGMSATDKNDLADELEKFAEQEANRPDFLK